MSSYGSSARYRRVEDAFQRAVDLPEDRRAEFLTRECGTDQALRDEVEALLRSYAAAGDIFDRPLYDRPLANEASDPVRIGRYRIQRKLGQGGMAVVYEATQTLLPGRSVAIKLIRPGAYSPRSRSRFEFEAAVLARLQHPGIAHIYEAGIAEVDYPTGGTVQQPFFAMEMVQGEVLQHHVRRTELSTARRLALFIKICDAVEHAHQKGVIHRDLKPSNIVVTPTGEPKVLDFGVARVTESDVQMTTMHSEAALVGTLPYMSPEQVSAQLDQLDTRSDVYALGVVLYELLAGRLPYDLAGKPIAAAARVITETSPTPLSAVDRAFRGDLETIVGKALEKDPARRYASVYALAEDIRRFLHHEPVAARPPSAGYQVRKFAQRNRGLVAGAGATLLALVLGLSFALYALQIASRERDEKGRALTAEQVARAESEAVTRFIAEMLASSDPVRAGRDARVIDLLDTASQHIGDEFVDQPLVAAALHHVMGRTYQTLGVYDRAADHLENALETRTDYFGEQGLPTLESMHELGVVYNHWGRYAESQLLLEQSLDAFLATVGEEHELALAGMNELALLYHRQGRMDEAAALYQRALGFRREVSGTQDPGTLSVMNNLGVLYKKMGRFDEALALYEETFSVRRQALGEDHPSTLTSMNNLAHLYRALNRREEAADLHARTLAIRRRVLGNEHPHTLMSMDNLAMLMVDLRRFAEAELLYAEALALKRRVLGEEHPETLVTMNNQAVLYSEQDRLAAAEALHRQTLEVRRRVLGDRHGDTAISITNLARTCMALQDYEEAERLHREALAFRRDALGEDHPDTILSLQYLAAVKAAQEEYDVAADIYSAALISCRRRSPPDDRRAHLIEIALADVLLKLGQFDEADGILEQSASELADREVPESQDE